MQVGSVNPDQPDLIGAALMDQQVPCLSDPNMTNDPDSGGNGPALKGLGFGVESDERIRSHA